MDQPNTMAARPSLTSLPTEILEAVFVHLDPNSLVSVSQTSSFINKLAAHSPIVWRHYCLTYFKYWSPTHNIAHKITSPLSDVNWRELFIYRKTLQRRVLNYLDRALQSQQHRVHHINKIAEHGLDVKDTLLNEYACPDDADDVLARRYYAKAVLERLHRKVAIQTWEQLQAGKHVPLEIALSAYDIFTRPEEDVDFDIVTHHLDRMIQEFLAQTPDFQAMSTRWKASTLASFFREQGFKGVPDTSYRALRNSFIALVLRAADHESLPLISVAIYCALASRLGLDARPCGFLFHVYCLVYAPKDYNLDGEYKPTTSTDLDFMYLDPFRSSDEVSQEDLQRLLREMGVAASEHSTYLSYTNTQEMTLRTARNIMNSVQTIRQTEAGMYGIHKAWMNAYPDMDASFYAAIWAFLILSPREERGMYAAGTAQPLSTRRRQYLPYLLEHFQTHYPWDIHLIQDHVIPLFESEPEGQRLLTFVQSQHHADRIHKEVHRRSDATRKVSFTIGQLFKHKRYHYEGVVTGWDLSCDAGEEWIQHMGVDSLPDGRGQPFYHVLCCDKSIRYVAEENILPASPSDTPSEAILRLAGRHFKRWDESQHVFISNIRDEYPDD